MHPSQSKGCPAVESVSVRTCVASSPPLRLLLCMGVASIVSLGGWSHRCMRLCVSIYLSIYLSIYMLHVHMIYWYIYIYIDIYICIRIHTSTHICMYVCVYIYIYIYIYVHIHICVYVHIYTHTSVSLSVDDGFSRTPWGRWTASSCGRFSSWGRRPPRPIVAY